MSTLEQQKLLELKMVDDGISRYNRTLNKMMEKGLESATKHGRAMITTLLDPVSHGIDEVKNKSSNNRDIAKKKLQEIESSVAAYLSMLSLVDSLTKKCTVLKLSNQIGMRIEDQIRLNDWIKQEGDVAKNVIRKANEKTRSGRIQKRHGLTHKMNKDGFKDSEWSNEERIHVGVRIISVIIETTGIVELKKFTNGRGKLTFYVIATPKTLDWIKDFNQVAEVSRPRYTPTIIPPKDWDRVWGGGYYANVINNLPLVRVH
tara:strand:- start:300 stop:1079 length:780 start_codon:yes stop_codon:yes gene_type:complete